MANKIFNICLLTAIVTTAIVVRLLPLNKETKLTLGYAKGSTLNFTEAAANHQYHSDEHTIVTEDGYMLTIFHIIKSPKCWQPKKIRPVLVMHGLFGSSDVFLDAGPSAGLAYLLADDCHDVWVGNQRGNNYGRRHRTLNPDKDADFWQFSVDELGFYDIPATINYILLQTGADRINYIGFSQGCGVFFAMCSERPDYCKKTAAMIALAPAVVLNYSESKLLILLFKEAERLKTILKLFGVHGVFSKGGLVQELLEYLCQFTGWTWSKILCGTGGFLDNYHPGSITDNTQRLIFSHCLVGTSLNNLARYGQVLNSGKFQKFDYGEQINIERYNSSQVPEYNLSSVSVPVVIIQGKNDKMVSIRDTEMLSSKLPHVLEMVVVPDPIWNHVDMIYNQNAKNVIYPIIYNYLQKYSDSER